MAYFTGSNRDVDASAEALSETSIPFARICTVKAGPGNGSDIIYVGFSNTITAGSVSATDGYPLAANQEMHIPAAVVNDVSEIFVIGSTTNLKVFFWGY